MSDLDHTKLLRAIGHALGKGGPYQEVLGEREEAISLSTGHMSPAAAGLRVLGGCVDEVTGRVAWVEESVATPVDGYVPVRIDLCFARGGRLESALGVESYNPYFGCRVGVMRWYGPVLLWIYREKHCTILSRVEPPYDQQRLLVLSDECVLDGDDVYFLGETGLIEGRRLPGMEALGPLPIPKGDSVCELLRPAPGRVSYVRWPTWGQAEGQDYNEAVERARAEALPLSLPLADERLLPGDAEGLRGELLAAVAAGAPDGAPGLLVDTVAAPFLRDLDRGGATYDEVGRGAPSPRYLVAYWVQHLRASGKGAEAEAWLRWLDRVAEGEVRWGCPEGSRRLDRARMHLRVRAAVLASIVRTGETPYGEVCHFFYEGGPSAEALAGYPEHVLGVIDALRPMRPASLLWTERPGA